MTTTTARRPSLLGVALVLGVAGIVAAALVLPYQVQLQLASGAERPAWTQQLSVWVLYLLSGLFNAVPLLIVVPTGLWAARRLNLGAPLIEGWLASKPWPAGVRRWLALSALVGLATGTVITVLDVVAFADALPQRSASPALVIPAWTGFLASFYGGVNEELLARLFFLSFVALGVRSLVRAFGVSKDVPLSSGVFWAANVFAALFFGASHLPAAAALGPLTEQLVFRTFFLNGLLALVFGWLYRRYGLEAAMVSHFCSDLVLHVAAPLLIASA